MRMPLLALALLVVACSGETVEDATVFSDSAGIRIASNEDRRPGWAREERWTLAANPRLQVGNVIGDPTQQLYQVSHARLFRNGGLAVSSTGLGEVRIFDAQGMHVRTVNVGVPTEDAPLRVWELPGDSLLVYREDRSLSVFDALGNRVREASLAPLGPELEPGPVPLGAFRDGTLLFRAEYPRDSTATGVGRRKVRLVRYGTDGALMGSFGDFDGQAVLYEDRGGYIFGPDGSAAPADSTIWYGGGDRYEVREVAEGGRTLRVIRLDRPGTKVLQSDITAYRSAAVRQVVGTPRESTMGTTLEASTFADTFPVFDRIIVDDLGDLWIRKYQWFDLGSGKAWTVFDPEGRYLGEVTTPSILEIHQIGAGFVLGRMSDGRGHEAVYIFDVLKPGTAAASDTARAAGP